MVGHLRTAGERVGERVEVAHGGMALAAHCTRGGLFPVLFSTGL